MRRTIKQRLTAGFVALALAISNVVLPAQTAFAMEPPTTPDDSQLEQDALAEPQLQQPESGTVVTPAEEQVSEETENLSAESTILKLPAQQSSESSVQSQQRDLWLPDTYKICHRTNNVNNPYEVKYVNSVEAVLLHGEFHKGPVALTQAHAQSIRDQGPWSKWGDIVPPIGLWYSGLNYTEGQAILENDCVVPDGRLELPEVKPVDPCNIDGDNSYWVKPEDTELITWQIIDNELVATTALGYYFVDGEKLVTEYNFGEPVDSQVICATPEKPKVIDRCGIKNDAYKIPSTRGVVYKVNGEVVEAGWYNAPDYGKVVVTAEAADGYVLTKQLYKKLHFTNNRCEADVKVYVFDKCSVTGNATVWITLKNNTDSYQAYYYEILDSEDVVVESGKELIKSGEYFKQNMSDFEDGEYTLNVYSVSKSKKGQYAHKTLLKSKEFTIDCADKFTPEIYKVDQDGKVISGGVFDVKVCQKGRISDEVLVPALVQEVEPIYESWYCQTFEDVTFGTDGKWFKENVDGVNPDRDVKVTITETVAPEGCKAGGPWVFNWTVPSYENGTNGDVQTDQRSFFGEVRHKKPVGSWDAYGGVFNLENDCRTETPEPEVPVLGVSDERPAPLQPQVLADTGDAPSAMILAALLLITGSAVLAVSPRFAKMK